MYIIKQKSAEEINKIIFTDENYISSGEYRPKVIFCVSYSNVGFHVHFDVFEKNPRAVHKHNFAPVYEDSCVEWFINFDPLHTKKYFNIEINANGCVDISFRKDRYTKADLTESEAKTLDIRTQVFENHWTVDYVVRFELIQKYFTEYKFEKGQEFFSNVYKCANDTAVRHHACWKMVDPITEDFHCPELFGTMIVE